MLISFLAGLRRSLTIGSLALSFQCAFDSP
jgi:hypothetical protein